MKLISKIKLFFNKISLTINLLTSMKIIIKYIV
jgi:hypothetical protein